MKNLTTVESDHDPDFLQLSLLVGRFLRILRGCGIEAERLAQVTRAALSSEINGRAVSDLRAPAELHLAGTDLVFNWRRTPPFVDLGGRPRKLLRIGQADSFEALVEQFAPHFESNEMLDYLLRLSAIQINDVGLIELSSESLIACSDDGVSRVVSTSTVLTHMQAFLSSVEYNLLDRIDSRSPRFERACYGRIPAELVPILERLVEVRGQNLIDSVDEWLARHRTEIDDAQTVSLAGVGAYVFAHPSNIFEGKTIVDLE